MSDPGDSKENPISRAAFFVVTKGQLGEEPAIYWDEPPRNVKMVYCVELSKLPLGDKYPLATVKDLFDVYKTLKFQNMLPTQYEAKKGD